MAQSHMAQGWVGSFGLLFNYFFFFFFQLNIKQLRSEARPEGFALPGPGLLLQRREDAIHAEMSWWKARSGDLHPHRFSCPWFSQLLSPQIQGRFLCLGSGIIMCSYSFMSEALLRIQALPPSPESHLWLWDPLMPPTDFRSTNLQTASASPLFIFFWKSSHFSDSTNSPW